MSIKQSFLGGAPVAQTYVDDVFSTYLYTGNGSTQTITNGIDLAGKGGMVWVKNRTGATGHGLFDTTRGVKASLATETTGAQNTAPGATDDLYAFTSSGFSVGASYNININGAYNYASWTFRNAPNFYHHAVVTKSAGSNATYQFSTITTPGMIRVKRTDSTGSWYIWHRSLTAGKLLIGETTAAEATLGHITVSGNTVTLVNGVIADGTYLVECFAHDTGPDGIIQCGSFTADGSGGFSVNLGFEPQFVLMKASSTTSDWRLVDTMRGFTTTDAAQAHLWANLSNAESAGQTVPLITPTGFRNVSGGMAVSSTYIYLAVRRSNRPPTSGTQVYNAIARTGTGAAATVTGVGFAPDMLIGRTRTSSASAWALVDRLRGATQGLYTNLTNAEWTSTSTTDLTAWGVDGFSLGTDNNASLNTNAATTIDWLFRRSQGVHDQICYTGSGANKTESHTLLGVAPELWLVKKRGATGSWVWGSTALANTEKVVMPSPNGRVTDTTAWNSTFPTSTAISLGTSTDTNATSATFACWMWATLAGVSKVFSYTGNGTNQTINCGFAAGARFILIIRATASTAQDVFIWDSARGIIAGNDPHLSLNTTAAEVTTDDSVDPDNSGFVVNQLAATNINVNGAVYFGLAYA